MSASASAEEGSFEVTIPLRMSCIYDRDKALAFFAERWDEHPVGRGLSQDKVIELLVSESGSWTLVANHVNGLFCEFWAGESWEMLPAIEKTSGEPT